MLTYGQRLFLLALALACEIAIAGIILAARRPVEPSALPAATLQFNARAAMANTAALAQGYPGRVTGTSASQRAAAFIAKRFTALGYRVRQQPFAMWLHGKRVTGRNLVAFSGTQAGDATVLLLAHYDIARTTQQGAEDDASGVGTLIELARDLHGRTTHVAFAATDAEEWGMIGARQLPELFVRKPRAAISIDNINAGAAGGLQFTSTGQFSGYTPLWLRSLMLATAQRETQGVDARYGADEFIDRAIELSFQDQGPLLNRGIPAINVMTLPVDVPAARARYHTPDDVFANFEPASFAVLGRAVERATLAVLALPAAPHEADRFQLGTTTWISAAALRAMMYLALLPLVCAWFIIVPLAGRGVWPAFLPPIAALLVAYALVAVNVLPRYELDPATLKDPFLYHPPLAAMVSLAAVLVVGYAALARRHGVALGKADLVFWLVPVCVAGAIVNPYGTWLYLGIFGYASLLFSTQRGTIAFLYNAALLLASALPFALILLAFGYETHLGAYVLWYLVLQAAYGVWSPWVALIAICALVLWVEFARLALAQLRSREFAALPPMIHARPAR